MGKSIEEKRAALFGEDYYGFVEFCRKELPAGSRYDLVLSGLAGDLAKPVMRYFLYPVIPSERHPDYILCYGTDYTAAGYLYYKGMDEKRYILKEKGR